MASLPLLDSKQMAAFVADGFLRFDAVVPLPRVRRPRWRSSRAAARRRRSAPRPDSDAAAWPGQPLSALFGASPAVAAMLAACRRCAGVIESLVGAGSDLRPPLHARHRAPAQRWSQPWHADAILDPRRRAFDIQLFFFLHDTPREMGGTMVLPGSHLRRINEAAIARYQNFVGQQAMACPAGIAAGLPPRHLARRPAQPDRTGAHHVQAAPVSAAAAEAHLGHQRPRRSGGRAAPCNATTAGTATRSVWRSSTASACGAHLTGDARFDLDYWLTRFARGS